MLIVIISASHQFPPDTLPKPQGDEKIGVVAFNTFLIFNSGTASQYTEALKKLIKGSFYVIGPDSYLWDGNPHNDEIRRLLDGESGRGDSVNPVLLD